ncbi:ankyrin repeat domain-containing protein 45 [Bombina bombina]|uniref:ankyrin repeat domain-containing protein 45 n=1 Tax=Bombina bombina TaxID=8345 RepID=UPI00235A63A3|nr:ankyrin repeat domain-containing protein 45 [Bombina bombina]
MEIFSPESSISPLLQCVLEGDVQSLQLLFDDKTKEDQDPLNHLLLEKDQLGRSPLFSACILGRNEIVKELVKYGASTNDETARGYFPIHCAAAWGQLDVLKTLVELGANILALNFRGEKACEIAARYNKTECAQFLTWAESKLELKMYVSHVQRSITEPEKMQVRLSKEEKNKVINACKAKNEWLEQAKNATVQDFVEQRHQLETIVQPIFTKMNTPRAETGRSSKH